MLINPLIKKAAKIQEAMSDSDIPPRAPTARMMATGPLAANRNATRALAAYVAPKSAKTRSGPGNGKAGFSSE